MSGGERKTKQYRKGSGRNAEQGGSAPSKTKPYRRGKLGQRVDDGGVIHGRVEDSLEEPTRHTGWAPGPDGTASPGPVVGWLVVESGIGKGASFPLYGRRNCVGRAGDQDVSLTFPEGEDMQVSRRAHCVIGFEYKKNLFILEKGSGSNYAYVNDEVVLGDRLLNPYDRIELGGTKLLFMPLCGEHFQWKHDETDQQKD